MNHTLLTPNFRGIIAINKPKGPTSHDIIDQVRRITQERKVGHAGTLDPLASGVLVVAIGKKFTKQLSTIVIKDKSYTATINLGVKSSTDDDQGIKTSCVNPIIPTMHQIESTLASFIGKTNQVPPQFSAIKINGKRAYKHARQGERIHIDPRPIDIHSLVLEEYNWPTLTISVSTGSGVYIRALARDIGNHLQCGAHLIDLVRTSVGQYTLTKSISL